MQAATDLGVPSWLLSCIYGAFQRCSTSSMNKRRKEKLCYATITRKAALFFFSTVLVSVLGNCALFGDLRR